MKSMMAAGLVLGALLADAMPLNAQAAQRPLFDFAPHTAGSNVPFGWGAPGGWAGQAEPIGAAREPRSVPRLVAGGLIGGAVGILAGAVTGLLIEGVGCEDKANPDSCDGTVGLVIGTVAGEILGVPLGVHLANGRQGRFGTSVGASFGIAAVGIGAAMVSRSDAAAGAAGVVVPAAQILTAVIIERRPGR